MRLRHLILLAISTAAPLCAQDSPETWTSSDGRKLQATGISWTEKGVNLRRSSDGKTMTIDHAQLAPAEVIRAVESLPFEVNDNIRLRARTAEVTSKQLERETGEYAATARIYSYDGAQVRGTVDVTAVTESYKISGRSVRAELSSINGADYAAVEFYAIAGDGNFQRIIHSEKQIVEFTQNGSQLIFSCRAVENFKGWVVLARSLKTGKVVAMEASMQGLKALVTAKVPETVAFAANLGPLKAAVIAAARARE